MRPHLSLFVKDVTRSVEFYSRVFGTDPQKRTTDYAKFDLSTPSLNFSFLSRPDGQVSRVGHLGVEVDSTDDVLAWKSRLEGVGVATRDEMATDCCYAHQDKVWFTDPDGNEWEIFYVKSQLAVSKAAKTTCNPKSGCCP